jgi:hypothetical protein
MKKVSLLIGVLIALSLVVGCGGGGSDDQPPTKAEFIRQADAICKAATKKIQDGFNEAAQRNTPRSKESAAATQFVDDVMAPTYQRQINEIRALGAPKGDEKQVDAMLTAMQEGLDSGKEQPLVLIRTESSLGKSHSAAQAYGLSAC